MDGRIGGDTTVPRGWWRGGTRRRRLARLVREYDLDGILEFLRNAERLDIDIGLPDLVRQARGERGDTALHVACYCGHDEAVRRLRAAGATDDVHNRYRLRPSQMPSLAETEKLIDGACDLLDALGRWLDTGRAAPLYERLVGMPIMVYNAALEEATPSKPGAVTLAIKVGRHGSLTTMCSLLDRYGDKYTAEEYLNCGSDTLRAAARSWAKRHGYRVLSAGSGSYSRWGAFQ